MKPKRNPTCRSLAPSRRSPRKSRLESDEALTNLAPRYVSGQQYSVNAITDSSAVIKERYAYDANGGLLIFDGSGGSRSATAEGNRITYTGREWDEIIGLYHYRARMYDPICGRFCSGDPIEYWDGANRYVAYLGTSGLDPSGLKFEDNGKTSCRADPGCNCPGTISAPKYELATFDSVLGPNLLVGVKIRLKFTPDDGESCGCDKIGFIQVAEAQPGPWRSLEHPTPVNGPFVDFLRSRPYYTAPDIPRWPDLIDMYDEPRRHRSHGNPNGSMTFETCAVCIRAGEPDSVLGCVTWGYKFTKDDPTKDELIPMDTSVHPSDKFLATMMKEFPKHRLSPCELTPSSHAPPLE